MRSPLAPQGTSPKPPPPVLSLRTQVPRVSSICSKMQKALLSSSSKSRRPAAVFTEPSSFCINSPSQRCCAEPKVLVDCFVSLVCFLTLIIYKTLAQHMYFNILMALSVRKGRCILATLQLRILRRRKGK